MYFWDVPSGTEMQGCPSNCTGVILEEGTPCEHRTERHVLSAKGVMLRITELPSKEVPQPEQIACFKAPRRITSVLSHGATKWICVGCVGGEVCILQALLPTPTLTDLESEDEGDEEEEERMEMRKAERMRRSIRRHEEEREDEKQNRADERQQSEQ